MGDEVDKGGGGVGVFRVLHFSHFREHFFSSRLGACPKFHNFVRGSHLNFEIFVFCRHREAMLIAAASCVSRWLFGKLSLEK